MRNGSETGQKQVRIEKQVRNSQSLRGGGGGGGGGCGGGGGGSSSSSSSSNSSSSSSTSNSSSIGNKSETGQKQIGNG